MRPASRLRSVSSTRSPAACDLIFVVTEMAETLGRKGHRKTLRVKIIEKRKKIYGRKERKNERKREEMK